MVGTRTIEATLPGADPAALSAVAGVSACRVRERL